MKIPFDIIFRPQIESGEYKVKTRNGRLVRIVCWDRATKETQPKDLKLCALVQERGGESVYYYYPDGTKWVADNDYDLFIITPEPELSEFEKRIRFIIDEVVDGRYNADNIEDVKGIAKGLLELARDQFIKDGYVIEKKAFHYAVEKVASEVMKEVSDKVDMEESLRLGYEKGRADALKDLPRWKKWENGACGNGQGIPIAIVKRGLNGYKLVDALGIQGEQYIMLSDLEKLAGFKED